MTIVERTRPVTGGVDTHLDQHVAAALDAAGALLGVESFPATAAGYRDPAQTIVMDLSGVAFMDSSCLQVLVQARGRPTVDGGSLVLRNPSNAARLVLTATQAEDLIEADAEAHPSDLPSE